MSDWLDKLVTEVRNWSDTPPKGFYSAKQAAKRFGNSVGHAQRILKREADNGKLCRVKVRSCVNGSIKTEFYYGPK